MGDRASVGGLIDIGANNLARARSAVWNMIMWQMVKQQLKDDDHEGYKTIRFLGGSPSCRNLLWIYWKRLWLWK